MPNDPEDLSRLFREINAGSSDVAERLFSAVYQELRRLSHGLLSREPPAQPFQTTELVHEAYLRLSAGREIRFESRAHFFGIAAEAMRRILIEDARRRRTAKRGGQKRRVPLGEGDLIVEADVDLLALDEALEELERLDSRTAQVVKYRFFLGLTVEETAQLLEVSPRTVKTDWQFAKAWIKERLSRGDSQ